MSTQQLLRRAQDALDSAVAKIKTAEHYMDILVGRGVKVVSLLNDAQTARMDLGQIFEDLDEYGG